MTFHKTKQVHVVLPQQALDVIFDECDRFDRDETGGRVLGTFTERAGKLDLQVAGIIEAGPQARRSPVSFFQDGEHQERIFRQIERSYPRIEHLGNWHTHHVNGLSTLSDGDITTYRRTVHHQNHNCPFFYALLVVARRRTKDPQRRYAIKHYLFLRDDERVYEIPPKLVQIVDAPLLWPTASVPDAKRDDETDTNALGTHPQRVYDRDILGEFYEGVRPFASNKLGLYWRGPIQLLDGSKAEVVVVEESSSRVPSYSLVMREPPNFLEAVAEQLAGREFPSARAALITAERTCNRVLFEQREHSWKTKST